MYRERIPVLAQAEPETYRLGENAELPASQYAPVLVGLYHTRLEHQLYLAMLNLLHGQLSEGLFTEVSPATPLYEIRCQTTCRINFAAADVMSAAA